MFVLFGSYLRFYPEYVLLTKVCSMFVLVFLILHDPIYAHFILSFPSSHSRTVACRWLLWVPDNNCSQSVILRNISCVCATYFSVSLETAAGTKDPVFKRSWTWVTWVIPPVKGESPCRLLVDVTHQLLIFPCSFIRHKGFKELTHFVGWTRHFQRGLFCDVFKATKMLVLILLSDTLADLLMFVLFIRYGLLPEPDFSCLFRVR